MKYARNAFYGIVNGGLMGLIVSMFFYMSLGLPLIYVPVATVAGALVGWRKFTE